jgi:hypothetical protein
MALAIAGGSPARAMALLISRASAPISMAWAASLGTPMPASTTTGTRAFSMIRAMLAALRMPWPEPIGEPSGITVAQPTSSNRLASSGSALM